jgi:hypothetical protein
MISIAVCWHRPIFAFEKPVVLKDTLHTLVTALHTTCTNIVLTRTLAWPDVVAVSTILATRFCPREICETSHAPNGLDAIVFVFRLCIIPHIEAEASEVKVVHCGGRIILVNHQVLEISRPLPRTVSRNSWVVINCIAAKMHMLIHIPPTVARPASFL